MPPLGQAFWQSLPLFLRAYWSLVSLAAVSTLTTRTPARFRYAAASAVAAAFYSSGKPGVIYSPALFHTHRDAVLLSSCRGKTWESRPRRALGRFSVSFSIGMLFAVGYSAGCGFSRRPTCRIGVSHSSGLHTSIRLASCAWLSSYTTVSRYSQPYLEIPSRYAEEYSARLPPVVLYGLCAASL